MQKRIRLMLILTGALLLCACGNTENPTPTEVQQAAVTQTPAPTAAAASTPAPTAAASTPAPTPASAPEATPAPAETETPAETVPFFADAAFLGNSLVDGLHRFGGLDSSSFYAGTSASVISVSTNRDSEFSDGTPATLLDALLEKPHGKIFLMLGINELGFNTASFAELYGELLDTVAEAEPEAALYVLSLTPITQKRSESPDLFTKEKVLEFNEALLAVAEEKGATYVDLYTPFADENGWLPEEISVDGVHFTTEAYARWADYLHVLFPDGIK